MSVYANGRHIVHAGDGGSVPALAPDACKTPSPGGPVPVPYPNIAQSSDLDQGTTGVSIEGNPVAIEGSNLKTSTGDEAGTAGGGVVSSKTKGKMSWMSASPDVLFEGKGVIRFLEPTGHNGNTENTTGQETGDTATAVEEADLCVHCGKPLSDPSHTDVKTDNGALMRDAVDPKNKVSGQTKGGIKVGDRKPIYAGSAAGSTYAGGGGVTPRNLATGKPLVISDAVKRKLVVDRKGKAPGNCVEQILLHSAFPTGSPFPPPGGPGSIEMGIAQAGRKSRNEKKVTATHKPKCATCEALLPAMLCTNKPKDDSKKK